MPDHNSLTSNLDQLQYVSDLLKDASVNKLSGREIMIPITSKAFFQGHLDPAILQQEDSGQEEQVVVKLGKEYLAEMSIEEASRYIEQRLKGFRSLAEATDSVDVAKEKQKAMNRSGLKKGFLNKKPKHKVENQQNHDNTQENKNVSNSHNMNTRYEEPILPFMDIVEEYDSSGKQVKAEALDVSRTLMDFRRKMRNIRSEEGKDMNVSSPSDTSKIIDTIMESIPNNVETDPDIRDSTHSESQPYTSNPNVTYEELSARLDQLAFLEAQEEKKKQSNNVSSKILQGTGWKKGFLSKGPSPKQIIHSDELQAEGKKDNYTDITQRNDGALVEGTREKKVQFSNSDKVKEIPRIDNKSIQSVIGLQRQSDHLGNTLSPQNVERSIMASAMIPPSPVASNEGRVSNPVSIGGVKERQSDATDHQSNRPTEIEPRKMSRFAQRRQQMR